MSEVVMRRIALIGSTVAIAVASSGAALAVALTASSSPAETTKARGRARVTAVLLDRLPVFREQYAATIIRQSAAEGGDLIMLPRSTADGRLLDEAVRALLHDRAVRGNRLRAKDGREVSQITLGVRGNPAAADWAKRKIPRAQRVVDSLFRAPVRHIPGVGYVPAVEFYPPRVVSTAPVHGRPSK